MVTSAHFPISASEHQVHNFYILSLIIFLSKKRKIKKSILDVIDGVYKTQRPQFFPGPNRVLFLVRKPTTEPLAATKLDG